MERFIPQQNESLLPPEVQNIASEFDSAVKKEVLEYAELYTKSLEADYTLDEEIAFAEAFDNIERLSHENPALKLAVERIEMLIMDKHPRKEIAA